jgi:hypothetical protein
MSAERPKASPDLLAALIESTPERVRKRLDRAPNAAAEWEWQAGAEVWSVNAGGETVTLPLTHVLSVDQVRCTCLLAPRCFHVLACLTHLEVAIAEPGPAAEEEQVEIVDTDADEDLVEPDEKLKYAANEMTRNIGQLLRVGVANAGLVVQSGLLRAVHQCRAEGLHRLAALGLRAITGINEIRSRAPIAAPAQLAEDIADILETSTQVLSRTAIPSFWIGTARRRQMPIHPRKLHGLFAEPILTGSGFAGAAASFLGEDDRIYTASDVRPGNAQLARDAYLGGIEIGPLIQPAKQLARSLYIGTDMTASLDGRLGRGKGIKIVEQGQSTWQAEPIQERFRRPLPEQWNAVVASAALPLDARPAGWDFVFIAGKVLGILGSELLFQTAGSIRFVRLAIANESETLYFRENLRMLGYAPGLRLQIIARVNLQEPAQVSPLAVAPVEENPENANEPRIEIPKPLSGRVCLGFDEIQRHWLIHAQPSPVVLNAQNTQVERDDPLASLRRRWIASMLSGNATQRSINTNTLALETATLQRSGFATGAAILDSLTHSHSGIASLPIDKFLAAAIYLRNCGCELAKARAMLAG